MQIGIPHRTRGIEPASARRGTWRRALESREIPAEKAEAIPEIPMDAYLAASLAGRLKRSRAPRGPSGYCGGRLRNEYLLWWWRGGEP
jgi:hypothetical protein